MNSKKKEGREELELNPSFVDFCCFRQALKKISTLEFLTNNDIVIGDRLGDAFT